MVKDSTKSVSTEVEKQTASKPKKSSTKSSVVSLVPVDNAVLPSDTVVKTKKTARTPKTDAETKPKSSKKKKEVVPTTVSTSTSSTTTSSTGVDSANVVDQTSKVTVRKVNSRPVLAKTTGINISPAKVKNVVSNYVLNKEAYAALTELKNARPHTVTRVVEGKEVSEEVKGTPVAQLSQRTRDYIEVAAKEYDSLQREDYSKLKVSNMPEATRKAYNTARVQAKDEFDGKCEESYLDSDLSAFDVEAFNLKYDSTFYDDYVRTKAQYESEDKSDEWKKAVDKVTKLKNRFSTNSRVFLSALVEYVVKQLALNGTVCCVSDKKKIIQLSHALDTSKEGFNDRFPLYPLIVNLDTFRKAQEYLNTPQKVSESDEPDDETTAKPDKAKEKDVDVFTLDGVDKETQYQFRYYVAETCRETRMDLAASKSDADGSATDVYNFTSVSKLFKNFCSTLVCELLMRVGRMLEKEIATRGIKTVNDTIIGTVISHYHTVCGVDETNTVKFIRDATTKYYSYVSDRQTKRKASKTETAETTEKPGGDMQYTES